MRLLPRLKCGGARVMRGQGEAREEQKQAKKRDRDRDRDTERGKEPLAVERNPERGSLQELSASLGDSRDLLFPKTVFHPLC